MYGIKVGVSELIILLLIVSFVLVVWGQIFHKAGHSRWLALLICVPLGNLFVVLWFAFSKWPVQSEIERLRMNVPRASTQDTKS